MAANGVGVAGVHWNVQIMGLKFLENDGYGLTTDAIEAVNYSALFQTDLTNNSWGGGAFSSALKTAIEDAGVLFVAAAGNDGRDTDRSRFAHYPASYDSPNIISVAATDHSDNLASFSNYGDESVDLGAPGVNILSTLPNNAYGSYDGTSMAAPHVAGVAALAYSWKPTATWQEAKDAILAGVDPVDSLAGRKTLTGGRLNAYQTLVNLNPSRGQVSLDKDAYGGSDTITIKLLDLDLSGPQTVTIASPLDAEDVLLTETGTGTFTGTIATSLVDSSDADTLLLVADGDTIIVTYVDEQSGWLEDPVTVTDTAVVDLQEPVLSNVSAVPLSTTALIMWSTDEPANSVVSYRTAGGTYIEVTDTLLTTAHSVRLTGLSPETAYEFQVSSTDVAGNTAVDPGPYTFETEFDDTDLVAYWNFDELSGSALDYAAYGTTPDTGDLRYGAARVDAGLNRAVQFDGVDDYMDVLDTEDINYIGPFPKRTISLWFQFDNIGDAEQKQVIWEEGGNNRGINVYIYNDSGVAKLYAGGWNDDPRYPYPEEPHWATFLSTPIQLGTWHHVALVLDAIPDSVDNSVDGFRAYVDGAEFGSGVGGELRSHDGDIGIGMVDGHDKGAFTRFHDNQGDDPSVDPNPHNFAGIVDEVRVYNRALTVAEILKLADDLATGNSPPVASDDSASTEEDTPVVISVLTNDTDADGDSLSIDSFGSATNGSVTDNGDGTLTYTPNSGFTGDDSFTYTASDGNGGTDTATVHVTVTRQNDAPVTDNDSYTTNEDTQLSVVAPGVLGNDTDADGDSLTAILVSGPSNGSLTFNALGSFTYDPAANFNGSDSFTYKANDTIDDSDVATVTINVSSVNDVPVAANDSATTDQDVAVTIDVLANDTDLDEDDLSTDSVTQGANGLVVINADDTVTYTPDRDFNGNDSFTYTVSDGNGGTGTATVTITVQSDVITMHVGDLDASTTNQGSKWTAIVTIAIHDSLEDTVSGAMVTGDWGGGISGTASCDTDASGVCEVQYSGIRKNIGVVTFTVTGVTDSLTYEPTDNHDPDGDSNGTTISVNKPLHAAEAAVGTGLLGQPLTQSMVRPAVDAAVAHWVAAGVAQERLNTVRNIDVEIVDLDGSLLGLAYSDWIVLDRDGAGFGWSSYSTGAGLSAGVDLFSAVTHELGHLLGYEHSSGHEDVMAATLSPLTGRFSANTPLALMDGQAFRSSRLDDNRDDLEESSALYNADLVTVPTMPSAVHQPQRISRAGEAKLLKEATDEATQLIDDELLDLLAGLDV
jgi:hypothetical protein